jgi:multiple sugar transport system permease protein
MVQRILVALIRSVIILFTSAIFLLPFLWMFFSSLRPSSEIFEYLTPFQWNTLIPREWTLHSFEALFESGFGTSLVNSLIVVAVQVPLALVIDSMAAFALSWLPMPRRNLVFGFLIVLLVIPIQGILIPLYLIIVAMNLQNTLAALIVPWLAHVFGIFLFRQFLLDLPTELADAAIVDGASPFQIYARVMLPNIKPAIVTVGLIYFMWAWNAFFWPLIAIQDQSKQVVQVAAATFMNPDYTDWGLLFAASSVATLPVLLLFLLLQRQYIQGVARSGIKG